MARRVNIVPHTHWDREWYKPFQTFRMRLVELVDGLLTQLESDPSYAHFMLDGQTAVLDDYLAIRPENEARLRALAAAGRVSVGPWHILVDEFLVSGETMVRDLQLGLERSARFGGAMEVGYLPDMFGHVGQMPQLLRQFGFDHAVVWRGVPAAVDAEAFWWEAPDGSTVRAEYLCTGYSNGALVPPDAKELVTRVDEFAESAGPLAGDPLLWMNGTDHLVPLPWLGRVVAEANAIQDDWDLAITPLTEHVAAGRTEGLPRWRGELRSGARANLLMGVASNRVDVHQAEAATQRALERQAEPLCALYLPPDAWPQPFLDQAWEHVIANAAHDSICACSVDEVGLAVRHRFAEATTIADGLTRRALAAVAAAAGGDEPVLVNPSARARSGVVELSLPGEEPVDGTQVLGVTPARPVPTTVTRADAANRVLQEMEINPYIHSVDVDEDPDGTVAVTLWADGPTPYPALRGDVGSRLRSLAESGPPEGPVSIELVVRPEQRVLAYADDVPGFGWRRFAPGTPPVEPVTVDGRTLANGLVTVEVDPASGTFSVDGHVGLGRLVDDGDVGDTYNWCPPARDQTVDTPDDVAVEVVEAGPLRGRLRIDSRYTWPHRVEGDPDDSERVGNRSVTMATTLEMHAGDDLVRVTTELDNPCRDHRLRAWFPLPASARSSRAECAFTVVERGLEAEGGPTEEPLPTYPSRRFVSAGGLTVAHDGLLEYELVDIGDDGAHALALTLLRCTGWISRGPMRTRPGPAGPPIATEAAQMPGRQVLRYAIHTGDRDPYDVADDAFLPVLPARPGRGPAGDDAGTALRVDGAQVSAVTRRAGTLEVRVFNPTDQPTTVTIDGRAGHLVDLRGRLVEPFEQSFGLRPHGIATAALS